jgi:hypothetical protein
MLHSELLNIAFVTGQVELLRQSLTMIEELHIMGNNISRILVCYIWFNNIMLVKYVRSCRLRCPPQSMLAYLESSLINSGN